MDRLNRAITQEMHTALAFLNVIDPDAFDIAFQAVPPNQDDLLDVCDPNRSAAAAAARSPSSPARE